MNFSRGPTLGAPSRLRAALALPIVDCEGVPAIVHAKPHCGLKASRWSGTNFVASSIRRSSSSLEERFEAAGAPRIAFEKETVDIHFAEEEHFSFIPYI
jgi:hypothetical protein